MEFYRAYDDCGEITLGTKEDCQKAIIEWCNTKEAKEVYSRTELNNIKKFFKGTIEDETVSYYGFNIEPLKIIEL